MPNAKLTYKLHLIPISFAGIVWMSLIVTLVTFGLILHKLCLKTKTLSSTFIDLIASLVTQSVSDTRYKTRYCSVSYDSISFRWFYRLLVLQILFITWLSFAFLISKHYKSSMTASLTIPHKLPEINTIEELLKSNLRYAMTSAKVNRNYKHIK